MLRRRLRRWFIVLVPALALGCAELPGMLGVVDHGLAVACETRSALQAARRAWQAGDVVAAVDILKAYLVQHQDDDEVRALLQLLESQFPAVL